MSRSARWHGKMPLTVFTVAQWFFRYQRRGFEMKMLRIVLTLSALVSLAASAGAEDVAGWNAFVIRNATTGGAAPTISDVAGEKLFAITQVGQKAGWGTNLMNGQTIGDIQSISITRDPNVTGWGPYMNLWVSDGQGGYAVLANEPSHTGEWTPGTAYDTTWATLQNATAWVYEVSATQGFKLPNGTTITSNMAAGTLNPPTFGDFANYTVATPSSQWGGTGAPDDLNAGAYTAYGVNWVFGDTQANYVGGYLVSNPNVVSAVPEPGTLALLLAAIVGVALYRRR